MGEARQSRHHYKMQLYSAMLPTLLIFAAAAKASGTCPSAMPLSLCCLSLNPFYDNEYVWENVCGVTVPDTSLLTAAGCEANVSWCVLCSYSIIATRAQVYFLAQDLSGKACTQHAVRNI